MEQHTRYVAPSQVAPSSSACLQTVPPQTVHSQTHSQAVHSQAVHSQAVHSHAAPIQSVDAPWQNAPIGRPRTINDQYLERLKELVSHSPRDYGYAFQRWTAPWLSKYLARELGVAVSDRHINRLLKQMGLSTRPPEPSTPSPTDAPTAPTIGDWQSQPLRLSQHIQIAELDPATPVTAAWLVTDKITTGSQTN